MRPASLPGQPPKAGQKINFRQRQKSGAGRNLSDKDKAGRRKESGGECRLPGKMEV